MVTSKHGGLSITDAIFKRCFDIAVSFVGLVIFGWIILLAWLISTVDTKKNGFFIQLRVGRNNQLFHIIKIRTMRESNTVTTTVTALNDPRITCIGSYFRKMKIDELPQLINVIIGHMSIVGPRPDVPGYADKLCDDDKIILSVRPGITGPASLKYKEEEKLLKEQSDPETYNRDVIFPDKVRINKDYILNYSFIKDIYYIWKTMVR